MVPLAPEDSALWLVLCTLAVWRITALLCYDDGPFRVLLRLRLVLVRVGFAGLITCFHCVALWVSLLLVSSVYERRWSSVVVVLAVAGAVSITERWLLPPSETLEGRGDE